MLTRIFGRHLYSQIVAPLVLASVLVGLLATGVAVFFLGTLTDGWVDEVALGSVQNLESRFDSRALNMVRVTGLAAGDQSLREAIASNDASGTEAILSKNNDSLDFDAMLVVAP
ncbi:MAG: hypothetical protein Q7U89_06520, partial [Coriobacteriia bacterium]|nr:hypothetical protein [Coriobacteriia bacterium]